MGRSARRLDAARPFVVGCNDFNFIQLSGLVQIKAQVELKVGGDVFLRGRNAEMADGFIAVSAMHGIELDAQFGGTCWDAHEILGRGKRNREREWKRVWDRYRGPMDVSLDGVYVARRKRR